MSEHWFGKWRHLGYHISLQQNVTPQTSCGFDTALAAVGWCDVQGAVWERSNRARFRHRQHKTTTLELPARSGQRIRVFRRRWGEAGCCLHTKMPSSTPQILSRGMWALSEFTSSRFRLNKTKTLWPHRKSFLCREWHQVIREIVSFQEGTFSLSVIA